MTYHLDPETPLTEGLRAVADDQIGRAIASLESADDDLEEAVHDARKRFKKLRGLLRLVRPGLGGAYRRENRRFRDMGLRFAAIRDAQAMDETLDKLEAHAETPGAADLLAPARRRAAARRAAALEERDVPKRIERTLEDLAKARKRAAKWALDGPPAAAVEGGLKKTYKRARNRHAEARAAPEPELLHEWRKRVKYHWYHCRLLRECWPEAMKPRIDALDALSDDLGDDHDLTVLLRTLRDEGAEGLPQPELRGLETLALKRGRLLRERALAAAPRLFLDKPGAFARRHAGLWALAAARAA